MSKKARRFVACIIALLLAILMLATLIVPYIGL